MNGSKLSPSAQTLLNSLKNSSNGLSMQQIAELIPRLELRTEAINTLLADRLADQKQDGRLYAT